MRGLLRILPFFAVAGCSALGITKHDDDELKEARARWEGSTSNNYSYVLQRSCFCGPDVHNAVRIVVVNGTRTSATYVESGQPVRADLLQLFPTMDGIFELLEEAYDDADSLRVTYDRSMGYPTEASIDYMKNAADDELSFTITDVQVSFTAFGAH